MPVNSIASSVLEPGYGYIRLISIFQTDTADNLRQSLEKFEKDDVPLKGLVLDLRCSPGGLFKQAVSISDIFLNKGIIVSVKGQAYSKIYRANSGETQRNYPIVVLISKGTAGQSEIIAGALQDNRRALILGYTSFGLGIVQQLEKLSNGYGIKFTIAKYLTPGGYEIDKKGIIPDVLFDCDEYGCSSIFQDALIKAALEILKKTPSGQFKDMLSTAKKIVNRANRDRSGPGRDS